MISWNPSGQRQLHICIYALYRNHISPSHSVSIYTCVLHIIFMIYTISYVYLHMYTYYMIYVYMYVYRIKNPLSTCMWSQEWVAAALCPWNPSTAGGSMRVKMRRVGEKCVTSMGIHGSDDVCGNHISQVWFGNTRLDLLGIRFGQRTNLKLMRLMRKKSQKAWQVLELYIGCDVRETLVMLRMRRFTFLRLK